jgi:hypothetical protein
VATRLTALAAVIALAVLPAAADAKPKPRFGHTVVLGAIKGKVYVKAPGARKRKRLGGPTPFRLGSVIDTTHGTVRLRSRLKKGSVQFGDFNGGSFRVTQSKKGDGLTDLTLTGGSFKGCTAATASASRSTAFAARRSRRHLFGHAHGRFRTRGRNSTATVRGTKWTVNDACDGTHTTDMQGKVDTRTGAGLKYQLDPGEEVTYYCSPRADPPASGTYCVVLLTSPADALIAAGIIDVTDQTQYDLCVTGPDDGIERCGTLALSEPQSFGFRESAVVCYAQRGGGNYTIRWRVGGQFLFPALTVKLAAITGSRLGCIHQP